MGQAAGSAREGLTDGSTNAAWRRAGLLALLALGLVLTLAPGAPRASGVFAPTVTLQTSTTQSAAHPDARITVDNTASDRTEDIKDLTVQLPDGFWGSLDAGVPCKWNSTANNAVAGTCLPTAKIGTVTAQAQVEATPGSLDSDMQLSGDVFLTDASTANAGTDPAGITAVVDAKVGGVNLGKVIVHARAIPVYKTLTGSAFGNLPSGTLGPAVGLKTQVDSIPNSVTDSHGRTVTFHTTKMIIDLISNQTPPRQPLLTNPTRCNPSTPYQFTASAGSYSTATYTSPAQTYVVTNCTSVTKGTTAFTTTLSNPTVNQNTSALVDVTMKDNMAALRKVSVSLPSMVQLNAPAYGAGAQQCPVTSIAGTSGANAIQVFNPVDCPDTARFGTIKIWTPLLAQPLIGYTYWVQSSPIPNIGVWVSPTTDLGNPKGITLSMVGLTSVLQVPKDSGSCDDPFTASCDQALTVTFDGLPSAPVSRIQMNTYRSDRPTLDKDVLTLASASAPRCQKTSDVRGSFYYYSSTSLSEQVGVLSTPLSVPGCTQPDPAFVSNSTSPIGTSTTNASPTFSFGAGASGNCAVDYVNNIDHEDAGPDNDPPEVLEHHNYVPCNSTYASTGGTQQAQNPLSIGLHYFYFTPTGGNEFVRAFAIDAAANETTPPTVTFDSGPTGDTSDSTPSFAFHASESSLFQCSLDNGAYLPCTNGAAATSSTYDVTTALLASDDDHTLRVRASDSFGNLGVAVTRTFKIVIPFDPTYVADYSTAVARAHPTLDVDITSLSHEDLDKLTISLPDGYLGSLRGAAQCPKTVASAGNCGAESQIGTVETEAAIDQSIARVNGTVYLTGPQVDGDPAGISVKVPARIQDVNLGNIIVPIRLTVRGHVKGIDSIAVDIPHQIDPAASGNTFDSITQFDMRSIKLKLRNNPSASQPLLTNPSSCAATSFKAEYTGTNATKVTKTQPFQATACGNLGLAPQMTLSLLDATTGKPPKESSGLGIISATMTVDMTLDPNGSGISSASVLLPKPVTVNSSQLPAPCTAAQYDTGGAESCPASTKVGRVLADSPLLLTPLEGDVYLVKSTDPSVGLPRLLLALRGAINTDIFGNMRTIQNPGAASQIRTDFLDLPDAPLSSLHVKIDKVVSTRNEACQYTPAESIVQTSFSGFSGAAATSGNPISITCNGSGDGKFSNKGAKSTLSLNLRAPDGAKFKSFSFKLPKGLKFQKKGLKKGFTIKAGTKKLKVKCAKFSGTNKLSSTICKTYNQRIALAFKKGTLSATKKVKKPKISVTAVDTQNRKYAFVITAR